ncbi:hypothetical protein QBC43DRAFT_293034 [Cladorrhinum sp. PSN259]|nr:hypothetical protein QBC43DRAFT_293034 [Cladorrhinum sp. PSN259]
MSTLITLSVIVTLLFPTVQSIEPASVIYAQLEKIQHDNKALHDTRAPAWVNAPNMRSTSSILYSCVLTLFACVYTALHLNIPEHSNFSHILLTKIKWVAMALFAPEIVLWLAYDQFSTAKKLSQDLQEMDQKQNGPVRNTKPGFFTRALQLLTRRGKAHESTDEESHTDNAKANESTFDLKYGFFVVMGGFEVFTLEATSSASDGLNKTYIALPGATDLKDAIRQAKSLGSKEEYRDLNFSQGEEITEDADRPMMRVEGEGGSDLKVQLSILSAQGVKTLAAKDLDSVRVARSLILDRSKADTLQKIVVLTQVGWMAMQCISRKIYGLPLCLLELHTMKPLDLRSAEMVKLAPGTRCDLEPKDFTERHGNVPEFDVSILFRGIKALDVLDFIGDHNSLLVVLLLLPILYGGIHLSAWNFEFPSQAEGIAWKIACFVIAFMLPVETFGVWLIAPIVDWLDERDSWGISVISGILRLYAILLVPIFTLCAVLFRIFIVVEAFISLRSVSIGVYWTPSWIQMLPHV